MHVNWNKSKRSHNLSIQLFPRNSRLEHQRGRRSIVVEIIIRSNPVYTDTEGTLASVLTEGFLSLGQRKLSVKMKCLHLVDFCKARFHCNSGLFIFGFRFYFLNCIKTAMVDRH